MGLTGARLLAVFAMLFGTLSVSLQSASAGAQGGGDSFTYDEDGLEWSVNWDDSVWSESSTDSADFGLQGEGGSVIQFLTLTDANEDPAGCLATVVTNFEDGAGATSVDPFDDDNGDPVLDDTDDYAYELRTVTLDIDGTDLDADVVHVCYALDTSSLLWVVGLIPEGADELDATVELFDGIEIAGDSVELGLADAVAGTSGTDDETPQASRSSRSSPSARPSASDDSEATEQASDDSEPSDDPTEEASDDSDSTGSGADEDAGTYESPTFGYSLEWNADEWTVEDDLDVEAYGFPRDFLHLEDLDVASILFVEGGDAAWSDADDCVATLLDEINVDPSDAELLDDENGEPFEISEDDRSAVAYQIVSTNTSTGDEQDEIVMIDCRVDPDSDLIVGFTNRSGFVDDYFGEGYPQIEEIIDSLSYSGGSSGDETPEASDDDEATPEARDDRDETPEASDDNDETPQASDDSSGGDGVDGNAYTSPIYGYELTWDEDIWTVEDESSEDDIDALTLSSDILTLNVTGSNNGDGDPETCLDDYLDVLTDRGNGGSDGQAEIVSGDDGDLIFPSDDGDSLEAYAFYTVDGENFASDIFCISLSNDEILTLEFTTDPQTLADEDASDQINGILDELSF